jgi:2-alkyl-3-oxoalkanoate reductase
LIKRFDYIGAGEGWQKRAAPLHHPVKVANLKDSDQSWVRQRKKVEMMKAMVTGGAGFTGRHLVERLVRDGHEVNAVDLPGPGLEALKECDAHPFTCDLAAGRGLAESMEGVDTVFHVAAFASPWGAHEKFWSVNVNGTENVIRACKQAGVRRLVMVSSTSAVFDGKTHHVRIDETQPYPTKFLSPYSSSKCVSERLVLAANSKEFETTVVRPHLIWGPRDKTFLSRFLARAEKYPFYHVAGGDTMTDTTYVENLVEGLVLAGKSERAPGNVYFITDDQPTRYGDFMDKYLEMFNLPPARGSIPGWAASALGVTLEGIWLLFNIDSEPLLSRYQLAEVLCTHTYRIDKAKADLGYQPVVKPADGFARVQAWVDAEGMARKKV